MPWQVIRRGWVDLPWVEMSGTKWELVSKVERITLTDELVNRAFTAVLLGLGPWQYRNEDYNYHSEYHRMSDYRDEYWRVIRFVVVPPDHPQYEVLEYPFTSSEFELLKYDSFHRWLEDKKDDS